MEVEAARKSEHLVVLNPREYRLDRRSNVEFDTCLIEQGNLSDAEEVIAEHKTNN